MTLICEVQGQICRSWAVICLVFFLQLNTCSLASLRVYFQMMAGGADQLVRLGSLWAISMSFIDTLDAPIL